MLVVTSDGTVMAGVSGDKVVMGVSGDKLEAEDSGDKVVTGAPGDNVVTRDLGFEVVLNPENNDWSGNNDCPGVGILNGIFGIVSVGIIPPEELLIWSNALTKTTSSNLIIFIFLIFM